jgi:hypothetical protein
MLKIKKAATLEQVMMFLLWAFIFALLFFGVTLLLKKLGVK